MAFRDASNGILGGGDLAPGNTATAAQFASSHDGGQTWALTNRPPVTGAIFCASYLANTTGVGGQQKSRSKKVRGEDYTQTVVVVANTGGAAWTPDEGVTWNALSGVNGYWGVAFANAQNGWAVGTNGQILKISFP